MPHFGLKRVSVMLLLCLFSASPVSARTAKDRKLLTSAMISASASLGQIQNLLPEEQYFSMAERFMQLARAFKSIERTRPSKGSKAEWDSIHQNIITLSFKAVGACADEDAVAIRGYLQHIMNYMQAGHKMFR